MARPTRSRTRNLSLGPLVQHKPPSPRPGRNHTATSRKQTHNNTKESGLKIPTQNPGLDKVSATPPNTHTKPSQQQPIWHPRATKFGQHAPYNALALGTSPHAGQNSPCTPTSRPNRYKTLPARPPQGPTGTKLSRHPQIQRKQAISHEQGESFPVPNAPPPSRENFLPQQHHLGVYFNAADRLVPTFTRAPDQCTPQLGIVWVIGCSS